MKKQLTAFTIMHFTVDLSCLFLLIAHILPMTLTLSAQDWLLVLVLYNFCAFALPAFFGLLSDLADKNYCIAAAGCLLVGIAFFLPPSLLCAAAAGVGNGFFHVGAGRQVLQDAGEKYTPSGIFISSGALGVFLGTRWGRMFLHPCREILMAALFAAAAVLVGMWLYGKKKGNSPVYEGRPKNAEAGKKGKAAERLLTLSVWLILLVVFLRSLYGTAVKYSWNSTFVTGLVFTVCIALGKALGGVLADRIGVKAASVISLGGAAVTVLFSADNMLLGFISILLFNMTMPLTLTLIAGKWKRWPGFAFGILMVALFAGVVPALLLAGFSLPYPWLCGLSILSLILLLFAAGGTKKEAI